MSKKSHEPHDENEIVSWAEQKLGDLKPYATQIGLFGLLILVAFAATLTLIGAQRASYASQWQVLNSSLFLSRQNQSSDALLDVAEEFPEEPAALWALMFAGTQDLRTGMTTLATDRQAGLRLVERARDHFQRVVDSNSKDKTPEVQQRALFSAGYAQEALGEFQGAVSHYRELIDTAPDSALADVARRGLARCEDPNVISAYRLFQEYVDVATEEAPGPVVPQRPDIGLPEFDGLESATDSENPAEGGESAADEGDSDNTAGEEGAAGEGAGDDGGETNSTGAGEGD